MSSDDEDYMSEKFLTGSVSEDVRPGLLFNHSQKRQHAMLKKQEENSKNKRFCSVREMEAERRQEGLSQALDSSNKGFSMLQKMGYRPGSAIGKSGEGRVKPIEIEIKADRGGLGRAAALKEIAARKAQLWQKMKERREQLTNIDDYRSRMARQQADKIAEADLRKSQRVCERLDTDKNIEAPSEIWFWPESEKDEDEEDEAEEKEEEKEDEPEFETQEKLEMLTVYLRKAHCYCIWCGVKYEGDEDLTSNCPGSTRDDH